MSLPHSFMAGGLMLASAALTAVATPSAKLSDSRPSFNLEVSVPRTFDGWRVDESVVPLPPSPDKQEVLSATYDQILSRTYVDGHGHRVMLSIAYGSSQTRQLRSHRQEVCYAAQGFKITGLDRLPVKIDGSEVSATRLIATQGLRIEPVTYWFTIGDLVVRSYAEREMAQFKYALSGYIPDGYLVRLSSLSADSAHAYTKHAEFADAFLRHVDIGLRKRLVGRS